MNKKLSTSEAKLAGLTIGQKQNRAVKLKN